MTGLWCSCELVSLGRNSLRVLERRETLTVNCLRVPRGSEGVWRHRIAQGTCFHFVISPVPEVEAAGVIKAVQNPAPPPGSRKLVREAVYQNQARAQHLKMEKACPSGPFPSCL